MPTPRLLVLDAYDRSGQEELVRGGATPAGELYAAMLHRLVPEALIDIAYPAESDAGIPGDMGLADYDGLAWTGSSLTIHHDADPRVTRQVELARSAYEAGVPSFGSCWAAQLAVVAAGGECGPNPQGREFGLAREIEATAEGARHPLLRGRTAPFDAFTSHADMVTRLPPGAERLAGNAFTAVQAVAVEHRGGTFWAVQYHPEYDLAEVAHLCRVRAAALVEADRFESLEAAERWADACLALHVDPARTDLAEALGVSPDLLARESREIEVAHWVEQLVLPRVGAPRPRVRGS